MAQSAAQSAAKLPLFQHRNGQWAKKIRGKFHYFGTDRDNALQEWFRVKEYLLAGRPIPLQKSEVLSVESMCHAFLEHRRALVESGELKQRTLDEYIKSCRYIVQVLGPETAVDYLQPQQFQALRDFVAKGRSMRTLHNEVGRMRLPFSFAYENGLIDKPVRYGDYFKRPKASALRKERHLAGDRTLSSAQIRDLLETADIQMRAMILLGIGNALGNGDCGQLEIRHLDLIGGWLDYPRPKTAVYRRSKLSGETVEAINEWLSVRPEPSEPGLEDRIFVTLEGRSWHKETSTCPVSQAFRKLLKTTEHYRPGIGFYTLRRMFETVTSETTDQPAIDLVMGHTRNDMASVYRLRIGDDRLECLTDHMMDWLFSGKKKK